MRFFIGLCDVASYESGLWRGLEQIGTRAHLAVMSNNAFAREEQREKLPMIERLAGDFRKLEHMPLRTGVGKAGIVRIRRKLMRQIFFLALRRCDTFVFAFRTSFYGLKELPLLRLLRKKIIYVFHGSDGRAIYLDRGGQGRSPEDLAAAVAHQAKEIRKIERYAHHVVSQPGVALLHRKPIVEFCHLGHPQHVAEKVVPPPHRRADGRNEPVRIVHAPSVPKVKDTDFIRHTVSQLREKGLKVDFIEVINRPNSEVLAELARCDFVIDQALSDLPFAGFGAEAALFARPSLTAGNAPDELQPFFAGNGMPQELFVRRENLLATAERLVTEPDFRIMCGERMHQWVTDNWNSEVVARRYKDMARGKLPQEWIVDPAKVSYWKGCGVSEEEIAVTVRDLVKNCGREALQLSHRPDIEEALVNFAGLR